MRTRTLASIAVLLLGALLCDTASAQTVKRPKKRGRAYTVEIDSSPQQATIYLDDKKYGAVGYTPYRGKIVKGEWRLILELPGYKPLEQPITVDAKNREFFFPLDKANGTIDIRADADPNTLGAQVFVDGQAKGTIPTQIMVPEGRVLVEIKKQGFNDLASWQEVKAGDKVTMAPQLKAQPTKGGLLIDADVPGATVYVDGKEIGDVTPAIVDNLDAGPHIVEVRKAPAQPWKTTVEVKPNARVKVTAELGKGGGTIKVLSNREDAEVWLDGEPKGKAPLELSGIPAGTHHLEVRAKGYKPREERVTVQGGQSSVIKLDIVDKAIAGPVGKVRIISPVPEAAVYIDGAAVGNAPFETDISAGQHFVVVQKPGFAKFERQVVIEEGKLLSISAELRAAGSIRFIANVDDAEVLIDGQAVGRTPLTLDTIDAGEHVVAVRRTGFAEFNEKVRVEGGQLTVVNARLDEDPSKTRRGLSSWGANTIPNGRFTVDAGTGYPYYLELRATAGVTDSKLFGWDFGLGFRSVGLLGSWEFLGTLRVRLVQVSPFALAVFGTGGAGGGTYSGRSEFTLQGGAIGTIQMTNILAVSGKAWIDFWSDRLCKEPTSPSTVSDNGPDVCKGMGSAEDRMKALALTGNALYNRDAGVRFYVSLVVEAAVSDQVSFYFVFEGAPFQDERAAHSNIFTGTLLSKDDPIYNGKLGLTFKF